MDFVKSFFNAAKSVQDVADINLLPPVDIIPTDKHIVLPQLLFKSIKFFSMIAPKKKDF